MDLMMQTYMEETEELLQCAEDCIIRLEMEYSQKEINELFRIVHTIKGSSHLVGYEDIGELMHKIEDMLDHIRNGSIGLDQAMIACCFEGLDTAKKLLMLKREDEPDLETEQIQKSVEQIKGKIDEIIRLNKKEEEKPAVQPDTGFVSSLLNKEKKGRNKFYISFVIEEDVPMISPVLMMILQTADNIGSLHYSSVSDRFFNDQAPEEVRNLEIIITTNMDQNELFQYFDIFYVESFHITPLNPSGQKPEIALGSKSEHKIIPYLEKACIHIRENDIFRIFRAESNGFIQKFRSFLNGNSDFTLLVFLDLNDLTIVDEKEIKELIQIKKELEKKNVEMAIVVDNGYSRRIMNIFDSISAIMEFKIFKNEVEAFLSVFHMRDFFQKLNMAKG